MFGMANGLAGFAGAFADESSTIRAANDKKAAEDGQIEQRALEHLANADDPQIRAAAVTAMLTPKKGGSSASGLQKWFGQQRDHPVFDQVTQLMNGGGPGGAAPVQPFQTTEEKAYSTAKGHAAGTMEGDFAGAENAGVYLDDEQKARAVAGRMGAPPSRPVLTKAGVLTLEDGTTVAGSFDPVAGTYADADGTPVSGVKDFHANGTPRPANPNTGGKWQNGIPDKNFPSGFANVHFDASGKEVGRGPGTAPNAPPSVTFLPTAGGYDVGNNKTGAITPAQGGAGLAKAEPPATAYNALHERLKDIESRARATVAKIGPLPQNQAKLAAALDAAVKDAQIEGVTTWAEAQRRLSALAGGVEAAVPGGNAPPAAVTPPTLGAKPGGAAKPPAKKGAKATTPGTIDVGAVRAKIDEALKAISKQD